MTDQDGVIRYSVSGSAAHMRLVPLLPKEWFDCSPSFCRGKKDAGNDNSNNANDNNNDTPTPPPQFVWENAPRKDSKPHRDTLKAYSHLPNGTAILDSKWVLARLLVVDDNEDSSRGSSKFPHLAALESHCFRGPQGYATFCQQVMFSKEESSQATTTDTSTTDATTAPIFPDLLTDNGKCPSHLPPAPSSLWVVKDAFSNGAGGIWVVDQGSAHTLDSISIDNNSSSNSSSTSITYKNDGPLYQEHRYVAQRYTWPPVLYGGRKCHVRVYGLITADGRAFVHRRAFLHVANDDFSYNDNSHNTDDSNNNCGQDSVHITNCCANSHDDSKFAGEILADLEATEYSVEGETGQTIVPLGPFFESMKDSLAALTERSMPFLSGGQGNNGFEYLGMDFILSYKDSSNQTTTAPRQPVAYLLEVNAPPSQDTATGLKHAEDLHDTVIGDILSLWVFPKVTDGVYPETPGGWRQAHAAPPDENDKRQDANNKASEAEYILPSKATIINKIRWGMVERRAVKSAEAAAKSVEQKDNNDVSRYVTSQHQQHHNTEDSYSNASPAIVVSAFARSQFPFFQRTSTDSDYATACDNTTEEPQISGDGDCPVFLENAGGSQVPCHVIEAMSESLRQRNRSIIGSRAKEGARKAFGKIMSAPSEDFSIFLGANASSLLMTLANQYAQLGLLGAGDEIVLSTENHLANVNPWLMAAKLVGASVKWWAPTRAHHKDGSNSDNSSTHLETLLTPKTRILAVSHASNVLGQVRDLSSIRSMADRLTGGRAHMVVDGVAAAPHWSPAISEHKADWYVISCHKLFGPHLGGLAGRTSAAVKEFCEAAGVDMESDNEAAYKLLEIGTINYEGCSGVEGLAYYLADLATAPLNPQSDMIEISQASFQSPQEEPTSIVTSGKNARTLLTAELVTEAFRRIRLVEGGLLQLLMTSLRKSKKVRVIEIDEDHLSCVARLPVVSFTHESVKASVVVETCAKNGIACRHGAFLSNQYLLNDFGVPSSREGVLRLSLAHYNTCYEIEAVESVLRSIPGWF